MLQLNSIFVFLIGCMAFLLGCSTTQVPEFDFFSDALKPVTIQGSIGREGAVKSISSVSIPEFDLQQKPDQVLTGTQIALLDDNSQPIREKFFFPSKTDPNLIEFTFVGRFAKQTLRLRVSNTAEDYEIALGTIDEGNAIHDLGSIDVKKEALATRVLEQSHSYRVLKNQDPRTFRDTLHEVFEKRIEPLGNWTEIASNMKRAGVDENGRLMVFQEGYEPGLYKNPVEERPWEPLLFKPWDIHTQPSTPITTQSPQNPGELPKPLPVYEPKRLFNFIEHVSTAPPHSSLVLYHSNDRQEPTPRIITSPFLHLRLHLQEPPSLEQKRNLEEQGALKVHRKGEIFSLMLQDMELQWIQSDELGLKIPLIWPQFLYEEEHTLVLEQRLAPTNPLVLPYLFFKASITPRQTG